VTGRRRVSALERSSRLLAPRYREYYSLDWYASHELVEAYLCKWHLSENCTPLQENVPTPTPAKPRNIFRDWSSTWRDRNSRGCCHLGKTDTCYWEVLPVLCWRESSVSTRQNNKVKRQQTSFRIILPEQLLVYRESWVWSLPAVARKRSHVGGFVNNTPSFHFVCFPIRGSRLQQTAS
jgi:hypothetical protein